MTARPSTPIHRVRRTLVLLLALAATWVLGPAGPAAADGGHILYAGHGALMSVPAGGGTPQRIATVPRGTLDLAASRDGRRIALISNRKLPYPNRGSVRSIYLFRVGHGLHLVRRFRSTAPLDIAISPDGRRIAFGQKSEIWLMLTSGGAPRQVTDGPSVAWDPAFTPDGGPLVFDRDAAAGPHHRPQLFRRSLAGGAEVQVSSDEGRQPSISTSGLLLYTRYGEGPVDSRLIVMHLDGSGRRTVDRYDDPFFDLSSTFSPDGRSIAYLQLWEKNGYAVNYRYSIHTKTLDGNQQRKLVGGLRSAARQAPFFGHGPAGPIWVP